MSDLAATPAAPVETPAQAAPAPDAARPEAETVVTPPNPVQSQSQPKEKPEPEAKPSKSPRDAIAKATEKVKAKADEKPDAKPDPKAAKVEAQPKAEKPDPKTAKQVEPEKAGQPKDERGRFASSDPQKHEPRPTAYREAPKDFDDLARTEWEAVPESVRGATHRVMTELRNGLEKHKEGAERWTELAEYDQMAKKYGTSVKDALANYVKADTFISENPVEGIRQVLEARGIKLEDFARHVLDRAESGQDYEDPRVASLTKQVESLTQQLSGVTSSIQSQTQARVQSEIDAFSRSHSRMDELANDIAFFLESKKASTLEEAYSLAEAIADRAGTKAADTGKSQAKPLIPAPAASDAGRKSIAGAPSAGVDSPAMRTPAKNPREALERARRLVS